MRAWIYAVFLLSGFAALLYGLFAGGPEAGHIHVEALGDETFIFPIHAIGHCFHDRKANTRDGRRQRRRIKYTSNQCIPCLSVDFLAQRQNKPAFSGRPLARLARRRVRAPRCAAERGTTPRSARCSSAPVKASTWWGGSPHPTGVRPLVTESNCGAVMWPWRATGGERPVRNNWATGVVRQ